MIINGGSRSNGAFFAAHLANGEHNECVTSCEFRNLAARTLADAFREMQAVALGTRCENYFYHANINPRAEEELTDEQWRIAVGTLDAALGLSGHARFVVEHRKAGRTHRHAIWSRINAKTMTAVKMTDVYAKHQAVARELERCLGLKPEHSVLRDGRESGTRPSRRPKTWESFRGQKSGINPSQMTREITRLYLASASGDAFAAELARHGCTLVRGTRSDYCIADSAGHLHSLARRIEGVTSAELKAFMRDIDPATLPSPSDLRPSQPLSV
jgi:hypothetical protein